MSFKKSLIALFFLLASPCSYAAEQAIGGRWSGLNNGDASILIGDNEAQDLSNVDITESGSGIKKRAGYSQFRTIGVSTRGVRGGYYYRNSAAADLVIHANSRSIFKSANAGAYSAFLTTATDNAYWDFADSLGYLYGANSSLDELWRYDGTTLTYFPNHPKGDQVEFTSNRLVISGTSANPKRLTFCKESDPTDCATSSDRADAFTEDLDMPGQRVNAIKYACGGVLAWTKDGMAIVTAQDQYDLSPTEILSQTIGTQQPYSVVNDLGVTYWQGTDNHFYSYDCNVIQKISRKLDVSNIVMGETRDWLTTTQASFNLGTVGSGLSTSYSPDSVVFDTGTTIDTFADGNYTSSPTWTTFFSQWAASAGSLYINPTTEDVIYTTNTVSTGTFKFGFRFDCPSGCADGFFEFVLSSKTTPGAIQANQGGYSLLFTYTDQAMYIKKDGVRVATGTWGESTSSTNEKIAEFSRTSAGNLRAFVYDNIYGQQKNLTYTDTTYKSFPTIAIDAAINSSAKIYFNQGIFSNVIDSTYQSVANSIGTSITSWGEFTANNSLSSGGSIAYAVYGDTDTNITITNAATFTSSQTITSGSLITIATAAYLTVAANFDRTISTQTPALNDFNVRWYEGSITRHWGSIDKDHRIIWSVAEGTATVPNVSYIYDPRFDALLKYSFPMEAAARVGASLYFGGVSTGVVYAWPSGNTDNGSAITAFWKSKDFIAPDPFLEKDYLTYSVVAKAQTGSNLDITYTINTSSTITNNFSLTDTNGNSYRRINARFPAWKSGTFFNMRFGNDDADAPFQIFAIKYEFNPRQWRVLP